MVHKPEDTIYRYKPETDPQPEFERQEMKQESELDCAWMEVSQEEKKDEKKNKLSKLLFGLFYDLQRHAKRILAYDLDKEVGGKKAQNERDEKFAQLLIEQNLQQTRELGRLIGKDIGKGHEATHKELEEKKIRPEMHAERAPGLQAGEKPPIPKPPGGLKHDFTGKPSHAGLGVVVDELQKQSFAERLEGKSSAEKDAGGLRL